MAKTTTISDVLNALSPQDRLSFKDLQASFEESKKGRKYEDMAAVASAGLNPTLDATRAVIIEKESANSACSIAARYLSDEKDIVKQLQKVHEELSGAINSGALYNTTQRAEIGDRLLKNVERLLNARASDGTRFFGETAGGVDLVKDLVANPNVDAAGNVNADYANPAVSNPKTVVFNQLHSVTIGRTKVTEFADLIASIHLFKQGSADTKIKNRLVETTAHAQSLLEDLSRQNFEDTKSANDAKQSNTDSIASAEETLKGILDMDANAAIQSILDDYRALIATSRINEMEGKLFSRMMESLVTL